MFIQRRGYYILFIFLALSLSGLSGCGSSDTASPSAGTPKGTQATTIQGNATAATTPQAGDIPDTQTFVKYHSTQGGYEVEVPEGWAQSTTATGVQFTSTFNSVQVQLSQAKTALTVESVRAHEAITLQQTGNAVRDVKVQTVQTDIGPVILITYTANSDANAVTGKQVRLENNRYLFFSHGKLATLTLSAPLGADNVDQWARMSRSFRWV
ncbi:MAG: lipoprotein [Ktedonobacteraceae bacterium]